MAYCVGVTGEVQTRIHIDNAFPSGIFKAL